MVNYKLLIENLAGVWMIADLGDDTPAMSYQINSVAELKDRQADYSQSLKLPKTPKNCNIFGYANDFDVLTIIPYRKLRCRLFSNDFILAGAGSYLILDKVTTDFEIQILSGNADLFEEAKNIDMNDVNVGSIQHFDTAVIQSDIQTSSLFYALCEFDKSGNHLTVHGDNFYTKYALPFMKLKELVETLLYSYLGGYSLQTDVPFSSDKSALRIGNYQKGEDSFNPYNQIGSTQNQLTIYANTSKKIPMASAMVLSKGGDSYYFKSPHDLTFKAKTYISVFTSSNLTLRIFLNDEQTFTAPMVGNFSFTIDHADGLSLQGKEQLPISLSQGDSYDFRIEILNESTYMDADISVITSTTTEDAKYQYEDKQDVPAGGIIPAAQNLGFSTALDVLKFFFQAYNLIPYVDSENKILHAYTFNYIRSLKSQAIDWSEKLNNSDPEISYDLGYAKKNYIAQKENSAGYVDRGSFGVDNDKLDSDKTIFELATKSVGAVNLSDVSVANIDDIELDEAGYPTFDTKNPACVIYNETEVREVNVSFEDGFHSSAKELPVTSPLNMADVVDLYYSGLVEILDDAKIIESEFYLTDNDIEVYRSVINGVPASMIPVYISKYGAYFYINKIKNFVSGKLTKCELIKM